MEFVSLLMDFVEYGIVCIFSGDLISEVSGMFIFFVCVSRVDRIVFCVFVGLWLDLCFVFVLDFVIDIVSIF